jgi:CMP/dCMP kinase
MRSIRPRTSKTIVKSGGSDVKTAPYVSQNASISSQSRWEQLKFIITVDGTAASGKSAISRGLARHFEALHINSGLMFRYLAWKINQLGESCSNNLTLSNQEEVLLCQQFLNEISFEYCISESGQTQFKVNGLVVREKEIETEEVAAKASLLACCSLVRKRLASVQRDHIAAYKRVVLEGRDAGSIIAPDALMKFYVDSTLEVRTSRRFLKERHFSVGRERSYDEVRLQLFSRDQLDKTRALDPLTYCLDMMLLDNTEQTARKSIQNAQKIVEEKLALRYFAVRSFDRFTKNVKKFTIPG